MNAATKIQTRNGRTLSYHPTAGFEGAPLWIMTGPTGEHSINAKKTCILRLAAHWSGFCDAKRGVKFTAQLLEAVVKAFLVRSDCEIQTYENECLGHVEMESTCFDFGAQVDYKRALLAYADITAAFDRHGNIIGYGVTVEWNGSDTTPGGLHCSPCKPEFDVDGWKVTARTARAAAMRHLVEHILGTIASDYITLPQIIGATA